MNEKRRTIASPIVSTSLPPPGVAAVSTAAAAAAAAAADRETSRKQQYRAYRTYRCCASKLTTRPRPTMLRGARACRTAGHADKNDRPSRTKPNVDKSATPCHIHVGNAVMRPHTTVIRQQIKKQTQTLVQIGTASGLLQYRLLKHCLLLLPVFALLFSIVGRRCCR